MHALFYGHRESDAGVTELFNSSYNEVTDCLYDIDR